MEEEKPRNMIVYWVYTTETTSACQLDMPTCCALASTAGISSLGRELNMQGYSAYGLTCRRW
jgi:hypothetical protein